MFSQRGSLLVSSHMQSKWPLKFIIRSSSLLVELVSKKINGFDSFPGFDVAFEHVSRELGLESGIILPSLTWVYSNIIEIAKHWLYGSSKIHDCNYQFQ